MQRRFCGNKSEQVLGDAGILSSDRELVCTLLDPRTNHATHLSEAERERALDLLTTKAAEFKQTASAYEKKCKGSLPVAAPPAKILPFLSGSSIGWTGESAWETSAPVVVSLEVLKVEAKQQFYAYANECNAIHWETACPGVSVDGEGRIDLLSLFRHDISDVMKHLTTKPSVGFLPHMALGSEFNIGTLAAESFVERVYSCTSRVMTKGNTTLSMEELEQIAILRMNKRFINYMRKHHAN